MLLLISAIQVDALRVQRLLRDRAKDLLGQEDLSKIQIEGNRRAVTRSRAVPQITKTADVIRQ
ncbi:hypothetical protein D3C85_1404470 [compost metagenome]